MSLPFVRLIEFFVPGKAAPQGSKRHVGRGILIESSKEVGPWRERVALVAHGAMAAEKALNGTGIVPRTTPVQVEIQFFLPRPASAPKKQIAMTKRPDIDKIARACLDALTDVVFEDDSQVVNLHLYKRYTGFVNQSEPGARIRVVTFRPEEVCPN